VCVLYREQAFSFQTAPQDGQTLFVFVMYSFCVCVLLFLCFCVFVFSCLCVFVFLCFCVFCVLVLLCFTVFVFLCCGVLVFFCFALWCFVLVVFLCSVSKGLGACWRIAPRLLPGQGTSLSETIFE